MKSNEIDNCFIHNNTKKSHQIIKDLTKSKHSEYVYSMNIQDKLQNDKNDVLTRWTENSSDVYNYNVKKIRQY